jgi:cytochrome c-type protein NapC
MPICAGARYDPTGVCETPRGTDVNLKSVHRVFAWLLPILAACAGAPAGAVDWSKVPAKDVTLLYPAQMSWELLLSQSEHSGADKFRGGKDCRQCHEGEERNSGKLLVVDKTLEPAPIAGKPGSLDAQIKAAHDGEALHVQITFKPGNQPETGQDPDYPVKVAMMIDDGAVTEATRAGCWGACHDDLARMPSGGDGDTTKYLARSRVKMTRKGGAEIKPTDDLAKLREAGAFLEYWQARLKPGSPAVAVDGTILEKRQENATPAVGATASFDNGQWVVEFTRKLAGGPNHKAFVPGKTYSIGFAIHTGHAARRFHYVSLEKTLTLDQGAADFVAKRD